MLAGADLAPYAGVPRVPRSRLVEENSTNHCTWRSHGHALVLESDDARERFLALVRKYKEKFGVQILLIV